MHQISTKTAPQVYFYPNSKNLHICIVLDCLTLITLSQLIKLINVSFGFQLEDLLSLIWISNSNWKRTSSFKIPVKQELLSSYNELPHFWKSWKLIPINEKLPVLICNFYMIQRMGFDDKTYKVFCESYSYSEY